MKTTQSYTLENHHIAIIKAIAKDHGDGSASAALRYIIDDWVECVKVAAQPQRPAPQAPPAAGEGEE